MGFWDWKNWDLKRLPGPLGSIAKAVNEPYKAAVAATAKALKGTPIGGAFAGLEKASHGDIRGAANSYLSVVSRVTGTDQLPGVTAVVDAVTAVPKTVRNYAPRMAGGAGVPTVKVVPPNLQGIISVMPASPVASPAVQLPTQRPNPVSTQTIGDVLVASTSGMVAAPMPSPGFVKPRRPIRTFNQIEWATHVSKADTVGGTQPAAGT